jgi:hypothetical protein
MVAIPLKNVIYIINEATMKTPNTHGARNKTTTHRPVRMVLALAGIVIAILSSLTLVQDMRAAERFDLKDSSSFETTKIVTPDLLGKAVIQLQILD